MFFIYLFYMKKPTKKKSTQIYIISSKQRVTNKLINKPGNLYTHMGKNVSFIELNSTLCWGIM